MLSLAQQTVLAAAVLLSGLTSQAQNETFDELVNQGGFYSVNEVPYPPRALEAAAKAVVRVNDCSGVILSESGLVVTNLHCLEECFRPTYEFIPDVAQELFVRPGYYKVHQVHERQPTRLKCPAHILRQFHVYQYQLSDPEILWVGSGRHTHAEPRVLELSNSEVGLLRESVEDIVLLKYKKHPDYQDIPCIPIEHNATRNGQRIWALGFPAWNKRDNGRGADQTRLNVSLGRVRSSVSADPIYQGYASQMDSSQKAEFWRREKMIWDQDVLLRTSADIYGGNSGGLMMTNDGGVAITFSISKSNGDHYLGATSFAYRLSTLLEKWERDLGSDLVNEIKNCKPHTSKGSIE